MKRKICYAALVCVITISCRNGNKDNDHGPHDDITRDEGAVHNIEGLNDMDREFITKATYANRAEVELGELADSKATNDSVEAFGEFMVKEHKKALDDLKDIASKAEVNTPDDLDAEHEALKARLKDLKGRNFDTAYMNAMVSGHKKVIALFEEARDKGSDARLKEYIDQYLHHIRMHLDKAESVSKGL